MDEQQHNITAQNPPIGNELGEEGEPVRAKKPYEKPAIAYRSPLEAMAATCTGAGGKTIAPCSPTFS